MLISSTVFVQKWSLLIFLKYRLRYHRKATSVSWERFSLEKRLSGRKSQILKTLREWGITASTTICFQQAVFRPENKYFLSLGSLFVSKILCLMSSKSKISIQWKIMFFRGGAGISAILQTRLSNNLISTRYYITCNHNLILLKPFLQIKAQFYPIKKYPCKPGKDFVLKLK